MWWRFWILLNITWVISSSGYRLPRTTFPSKYDISLDVDPAPGDFFTGVVSILASTFEDTSSIVLHAENLNMTTVSVLRGGKDLYSSHTQASDDTHFLTLVLSEELKEGDEFVIEIAYQGMYYDYQSGIFRDSYEDKSGSTRYLLGTQLESTHARKVFPSYDEPDHKATFDIAITCPSTYHAVSNGPLISTQPDGAKTKYSFKSTPHMASYLVAFVVSEFAHVSNSDEDVEQYIYPKDFRCYVQPDERKAMNFSLDFGQRSLSVLEEFTDVTYEMEKMDNVGIPSFGGAMENWGLVIYGEYALAEQRNENGQIINRYTIGEIMSHEFAHMWFGNEVTPKWWGNVWLSEGFATYFQYYATSIVKPQWKSMNKFVTRSVHSALFYDSYISARSMNHYPSTPAQISQKFNYVSYAKAGSVIRMMSHVLGEDTYRKSLQIYLKSIPKGSTIPVFLYDAMQSAASESKEAVLPEHVSVREVMGSWADQPGYPLITINRTEDKDAYNVYQSRYFTLRDKERMGSELFWVPLNWVTESSLDFSNTSPQIWMPPMSHMTVKIEDSDNYFILNKQQTGYYRIMYDKENWDAIHKVLDEDPQQIHVLNRAQIIDDTMEFSYSGILPYNTSMKMLSYMAKETDITPWEVAQKALRRLKALMKDSSQYSKFQKMVLNLNAKRLNELGFSESKKDEPLTKINRLDAIKLACDFNSLDCIARGIQEWLTLRNTPNWGAVLCAGLRAHSPERASIQWSLLWETFTQTKDSDVRSMLMKALSCVPSKSLLTKYVKYSIQKDIHTYEVSPLVESIISSTPQGSRVVLDFMYNNMNLLKNRLWSDFGMSDIFDTLANHVTTENEVQKLEAVLNRWGSYLSGKEQDELASVLEVSRNNLRWIKEGRPELENWLKQNML